MLNFFFYNACEWEQTMLEEPVLVYGDRLHSRDYVTEDVGECLIECMWVRTKHAGRIHIGLWGSSSLLEAKSK